MSPDDHAFAPAARAKKIESGVTIVPSVCPHDCTSTCALDVERLDAKRIGRVRGSMRNDYTAGVICEKVARYAERIHHPDRLMKPLRRIGPKGSQAVRRDLVGRRARHRRRAVHRQGAPARQRDGVAVLLRRHDGAGAARRHQPAAPRDEVLALVLDHLRDAVRHRLDRRRRRQARRRRARGRRAFRPGGDLGRQSGEHPGQRHDPRHARQEARRQAGRGRSLPHRHGRAGRHPSRGASRHRRRAGRRPSCMSCSRKAMPTGTTCAATPTAPDELAAHVATRTPEWAAEITGLSVEEIVAFARLYGQTKAAFIRCHHGFSRSRNGAANMHAVDLPAGGDRRLEVQGRRRALRPHRHVPAQQDADRRPRHGRPLDARARPVAPGADPDRRPGGAERTGRR